MENDFFQMKRIHRLLLITDPAPSTFVGFGIETVTTMMQVGYYNASAR